AADLLAFSYGETGDYMTAIKLEMETVEIEPNLQSVRHNLLGYMAAQGAFVLFREQFNKIKHKWPIDNEVDDLAARVYLSAGRPDLAADLRVPDAESQLITQIRQETVRRERARARMAQARRDVLRSRDDKAFKALKKAYTEYDKDVEIAFNWGHL